MAATPNYLRQASQQNLGKYFLSIHHNASNSSQRCLLATTEALSRSCGGMITSTPSAPTHRPPAAHAGARPPRRAPGRATGREATPTHLYLEAERYPASLPPCVAPHALQGNMGVADVDSSEPQKGELKMSSDYPQETVPEAQSPRKPQPPKVSKTQMVRAAIASCCLFATLIVIVLLTAKMVEPIFHRAQLERLRVACVPEPYETAKGDSLKSIVAAHPEHGVDWQQLCHGNGLSKCENMGDAHYELEVGTKLTLPCWWNETIANISSGGRTTGPQHKSFHGANPYMQTAAKMSPALKKAMADAKAASAAAAASAPSAIAASMAHTGVTHGVAHLPAHSANHTRATAVVAEETARANAALLRAKAAAKRAKEAGAKAHEKHEEVHSSASRGPSPGGARGAAEAKALKPSVADAAKALTPSDAGSAGIS